MNLPVENLVEQAVSRQVNHLVGNKDTNLNTIIKMALIPPVDSTGDEYNFVLAKMKANNSMEKLLVEDEYQLIYDLAGNLIPVKYINDTSNQSEEKPTTDSGSVIPKPEGSK